MTDSGDRGRSSSAAWHAYPPRLPNRTSGWRIGLACVALSLAPNSVPAQTAPRAAYSVLALGELRPVGATFPRGVSACGEVVGNSGFADGIEVTAFMWSEGRAMRSLGTLPGGDYSLANGVDSEGDVAGSSNTGTALRAVLWSRNGRMLEIGTLPGDQGSEALGINDSGQVVGYSSGPRGVRAFLWTRQDGIRDLGGVPGSDYTQAVAVNDSGQVAGRSGRTGATHAFLWTPEAGMLDLGTLPGDRTSAALGINNLAEVVGSSTGPRGTRAFRWSRSGGMRELGALPGDSFVEPHAINSSGEVVGVSSGTAGARAFRWVPQGGMKDLNDLIPSGSTVTLTGAFGINDRGEIVAFGAPKGEHAHHSNAPRAFLLTPAGPGSAEGLRACLECDRTRSALQASSNGTQRTSESAAPCP